VAFDIARVGGRASGRPTYAPRRLLSRGDSTFKHDLAARAPAAARSPPSSVFTLAGRMAAAFLSPPTRPVADDID